MDSLDKDIVSLVEGHDGRRNNIGGSYELKLPFNVASFTKFRRDGGKCMVRHEVAADWFALTTDW